MLKVSSVTAGIGGKCLLNDITLCVKPGEVLAVIGPNGAGKSTLLKTMCGDIEPERGCVRINDIDLDDWKMDELARVRGVLPQASTLSFPFTAFEVVSMGRSPHRRYSDPERDEAIVRKAMALTDTEHFIARTYTTLSGGERQRVQLARVLAQIWENIDDQPRYLLLDEPTSALDLSHQHGVLAIARRFADLSQAGVMAILHDFNLAALYADRIAVLHSGRLMAYGIPSHVLNADLIMEIFSYPVTVAAHPMQSDCPIVIPHLLQNDRGQPA